ncbi:MAG: ATP-binding protein, partial [Chloroflexota bacterium]
RLNSDFFAQIFDALATSASPQELVQVAARVVAEALGDWCALWLYDRVGTGPGLAGIHHCDSGKLIPTRIMVGEWFSSQQSNAIQQVAYQDQPAVFTLGEENAIDVLLGSEAQAQLAKQSGTASLILIPLIRYNRRFGILGIGSSDPLFATSADNLEIANEMGRHITTAIAHLQKIALVRQTSQQLTFTSLRLQAILESIPQGVIVTDSRNGRPSFTNSSFNRILGLPENTRHGDITNAALSQITYANGWPYSPDELPWTRSMRTGLPTQPEEITIHHADNRKLTVLCSASPIRDERGSIIGAVALLQDISERKEFEHQKDEFLAMVAHELRTPLTALKGYIQILLRRMTKETAPQFGEREMGMLQVLDRQVNRFSRLVFQLLDFSRIQAGKLELNPSNFSLSNLARTVVAQQQVAAPDRLIRLVEDGDTTVWADQDRVEQVLTNLLSNAIKATKSGSEIIIQLRREQEWVKTSIIDNGVGISEEAKERLFERMYRGPGNSHEGMGLGLFISKGVIDAHEGKIWFESTLGKGSTFHFTLPSSPPN